MPKLRKKTTEAGSADATKKVIKFKKKTKADQIIEPHPHPPAKSFKAGHNQTSGGDDHIYNDGGHSQAAAGLNHSPASDGGHSQGSIQRNKQYGNKGRYGI